MAVAHSCCYKLLMSPNQSALIERIANDQLFVCPHLNIYCRGITEVDHSKHGQ